MFLIVNSITIHAVCNECSLLITSPSLCPIWNINEYGLDNSFKIIENTICNPDNWTISIIPQNQPTNICTWNTKNYNSFLLFL